MKAVIFDMDGVLVDTEPLYMHYVLEFYHKFHQKLTYQQVSRLAGSSSYESWRMMGEWWCPKKTPMEMEQFYSMHVDHEEIDYTQLLNPYVSYILPRLKQEGYRLAIASSSPIEDIKEMCRVNHLEDYFDLLVSGDFFERSKPDPEIYLDTMQKMKVEAEDCVIIEDSNYGIEAGKQAGAFVIAKKDERFGFDQSKADHRVYDLLEAYHYIHWKGERNDRKTDRLY